MYVLQDVRLLGLDSGEVLVSFSAYPWAYQPEHWVDLSANGTYWEPQDWYVGDAQLVAKLHISSDSQSPLGLTAHIQKSETRVLRECPEKGLNAPGTKKNFGFFSHSGDVYALDWMYPTQAGLVNVDEMAATQVNEFESLTKLCFGVTEAPPDPTISEAQRPWAQSWSFSCSGTYHADELHNNVNPVWLEETGEYLGIGHVVRSCYHMRSTLECEAVSREQRYPRYGHHYTHFFFALSSSPPFSLSRISNTEFCMASEIDDKDCDLVQFIAGMARDGDDIVFTYGIHDVWGYVSRIKVKDVIASLVAPYED